MLIAVLAATAVLDIAAASEKPELSHLLDTVGLAVERKLRGLGESDTQFKNRRAEAIHLLVDHLLQSADPSNTTRGRRLTEAGVKMKNYVDALIGDNDEGCQQGDNSHNNALEELWDEAKSSMDKSLNLFGSAKNNNQGAIDTLNSIGSNDHIKKALDYFGNHIGGIILNNHDIAYTGWKKILKSVIPIVNGLKRLAEQFLGFMSKFVKPTLPLPTEPPVSPRRRSFLVAAAGLVTMLAAITAGSYRWNMLTKKIGPLEANKMLAHDAEITDTD